MANTHTYNHHVSDERRRDFLKALGAGGTVAVGSATLNDVRQAVSAEEASELAPIGQAIKSDLSEAINAGLLASQQERFVKQASVLPAVAERGVPDTEPYKEFASVAETGWPAYEHLKEVGFFESTTEHLPEFTPEYIVSSMREFVSSKVLAAPLAQLGFSEAEMVDLSATVVSFRERIGDWHWVATDQLSREQFEFVEHVPPMTQGAAGGVLLWLEDLDQHLWQKRVLLTDAIVNDAVWHARSMAGGFNLVAEGARLIGEESTAVSEQELAALLSSGFALMAIAQNRLPEDVYWITEEMRAPR